MRVFPAVDVAHLLQTVLLHLQRHFSNVARVFMQCPNVMLQKGSASKGSNNPAGIGPSLDFHH